MSIDFTRFVFLLTFPNKLVTSALYIIRTDRHELIKRKKVPNQTQKIKVQWSKILLYLHYYIIQPTPYSSLTSIFTWAVFKLRSAVFCDWHVKVVLWCSFWGLIFNIDFETNLWLSGIGSLMLRTPVVMVFPDPSSHVNWNNKKIALAFCNYI